MPRAITSEKVKADKRKSAAVHARFIEQIIQLELPYHLKTEHKFHIHRMWRFDFAWPKVKIAFEVEGGIFQKSQGHRSIKGFFSDIEKYNEAAFEGWFVFRVTPDDVYRGLARDFVLRVFENLDGGVSERTNTS